MIRLWNRLPMQNDSKKAPRRRIGVLRRGYAGDRRGWGTHSSAWFRLSPGPSATATQSACSGYRRRADGQPLRDWGGRLALIMPRAA